MNTKLPDNKSLLLVGGLPRSGGSLLPFFLDGNPGVISIPFEIHLSRTRGQIITDEWIQEGKMSLKKEIIRHKLLVHDGAEKLDKSKQVYQFDARRFASLFDDLTMNKAINAKNYLAAVADMWLRVRTNNETSIDNNVIVNHSGSAFSYYTEQVFSENDLGWYIYTQRNSQDWYASFSKVLKDRELANDIGFAKVVISVKSLADSLAGLYQKKHPRRFLVVDYDEILRDPVQEYRRIARFLGLEDTPQPNTAPTFFGEPVQANSSFADKKEGRGNLVKTSSWQLAALSEGTRKEIDKLVHKLTVPGDDCLEQIAERIHSDVLMMIDYWVLLRQRRLFDGVGSKKLLWELFDRVFRRFCGR